VKPLKFIVVSTILVLCLASVVQANGGDKGFIARIIGFIKSLFGLSSGEGESSEATTTTLLCTRPYIQVGTDCCLDANSNNICDSDEEEETTTTPAPTTIQTTTTVMATTTTTIQTTTTTTIKIECHQNSDCGQSREERICYKGDVYLQRVTPKCQNPGKADAKCIESRRFVGQTFASEAKPVETCSPKTCQNGECV
jgi:hypothetical protein